MTDKMIYGEVITSWTGTGTEDDPNRPLLGDTHKYYSYKDATGQPTENIHPDPNMFVVEIYAHEQIFDGIEADPDCYVLWTIEATARSPLEQSAWTSHFAQLRSEGAII